MFVFKRTILNKNYISNVPKCNIFNDYFYILFKIIIKLYKITNFSTFQLSPKNVAIEDIDNKLYNISNARQLVSHFSKNSFLQQEKPFHDMIILVPFLICFHF